MLKTKVMRVGRWVLLGNDDGWGARLATGRTGIYALALLVLLLHTLDLATGLQMMITHGVQFEMNPLARVIMRNAGPIGLVGLKLGVVLCGVMLFVRAAHVGRARLARNCLICALGLGILGFVSNLV